MEDAQLSVRRRDAASMSEWRDDDGYPTDAALDLIRSWDAKDGRGLLGFLGSCWNWPDRQLGIETDPETGWSGKRGHRGSHENQVWWMFHWLESRRGGHFKFLVKTDAVR